eukprot:3635789-Amphidinium_carterae.1
MKSNALHLGNVPFVAFSKFVLVAATKFTYTESIPERKLELYVNCSIKLLTSKHDASEFLSKTSVACLSALILHHYFIKRAL